MSLLFFLSLLFLPSCGPGTFFGTWTQILSPGSSSSPAPVTDPQSLDNSEPGYFPQRLKINNVSRVIGIPNRDKNLLMLQDSGGHTGFSVATGDFNNDGTDDLVLGAPDSEGVLAETTTSGWVYMVYGRKNFPRNLDLYRQLSAGFWEGARGGRNRLGHSLGSSDLNGDGVTDLIIGSPDHNGEGGQRIHSGAIFIVFGSANFKKANNLSQMADLVILGAQEGDWAGFSLASANLNGDGYGDLIIGAPGSRNDESSKSSAGAVYLLFGRKQFPKVIDLAHFHDGRLSGIDGAAYKMSFSGNMADQAGYSVSSGDVNSDGFDDVFIGAPFADGYLDKGEDVGEVYVVLGRKKFPENLNLQHEANSTIYGSKNFEYSGKQLASGDIDGDGIKDIFISSPGIKIKSKNIFSSGVVFGIPGRKNWPKNLYAKEMPSLAFVNHYTPWSEDYESAMSGKTVLEFGSGLASMDLNGDKKDDLLIGVPGAPEQGSGFGAGSMDFFITNKNNRMTPAAGVFQPKSLGANDSLGKSIALGDLNGDGHKDILIGAPGMLRSKKNGASGGAYIIFSPKTPS